MPRGHPVDGIGIVHYPDAVSGQLVPESYRPRTGDRGGLGERGDPCSQLLRRRDERLPGALARGRVERGEDLAAVAVEHGQALALRPGLADPHRQHVERADAAHRQPEADAEPAGSGDADPQAGEGAGAEADRDQVDLVPAASRGGGPLDLVEQAGRVQGPSLRGEPQPRLVQRLAVAPGAGGRVGGGGIEADDDQRLVLPSR
ncbi:MAG TPA: hypothetical protein VF081_09510 [Solirubrobacterales bacterium]